MHVLCVSHPSVLNGSTDYAQDIVANVFRDHTHFSPDLVKQPAWKFIGFKAGSKLEIAFEGLPHSYRAPRYKVYKYQRSEGFTAYFEVEVRILKRYIPPGTHYDLVEIERTDYLPIVWNNRA